jgi:MFS family permease
MTNCLARFSAVYALANFGAFLCFIPLMGLILPQRMSQVSGGDAIQPLSWALLLGALVASVANIVSGTISDHWLRRHGSRLPLIRAGTILTLMSFLGLALADNVLTLILGFLLFQLCFNLMFAPLAALVTDYVEDQKKGLVFGLLSFALPLAQASIFVLAATDLGSAAKQLALVAVIVTLSMAPLLLLRQPPLIAKEPETGAGEHSLYRPSRDFALAWMSRLLIQCPSVVMSSYIFVHLAELAAKDPSMESAELWIGRFAVIAAIAGALTGLTMGIASDRLKRRRLFLWPTALAVSCGCATLAQTHSPEVMLGGYALFAFGLAGFLTIDGAMIAQLVGTVPNRAAALGVMNLTNTLSGVVVPAAALAMSQVQIMMPTTLLFAASAIGAMIAAILISMIRSVD